MTYVDKIIATFGGQANLARALGLPARTVTAWAERGAIHDKHKPGILNAARANSLPLTEADFFPTPPDGPFTPDR
jgi:hypothetical protein